MHLQWHQRCLLDCSSTPLFWMNMKAFSLSLSPEPSNLILQIMIQVTHDTRFENQTAGALNEALELYAKTNINTASRGLYIQYCRFRPYPQWKTML